MVAGPSPTALRESTGHRQVGRSPEAITNQSERSRRGDLSGVTSAAFVAIEASVLTGNTAVGHGGAIANYSTEAAYTSLALGANVSDNTAYGNGGGVFNTGTGLAVSLVVQESIVSGNAAMGNGEMPVRTSDGAPMRDEQGSLVYSGFGGGVYNQGRYISTPVTLTGSVPFW